MKCTNIILISLIFLVLIQPVSALSFNNFSSGGVGAINTGNGYFDDPGLAFGYTDTRNVYLVAEDTQAVLVEPISWVSGSSPTTYTLINSSLGTITDAVVHNGYVYFVDGGTLKKRKTRNMQTTCESTDTSAGGCITTVKTGIAPFLRVYDGVLYYFVGTALKHLDSNDNQVDSFSGTTLTNDRTGWTITKNNSVVTLWEGGRNTAGGSHSLYRCTSVSCVEYIRYTEALGSLTGSMFTTTNFLYFFQNNSGIGAREYLIFNSNGTQVSVDYITTDLGIDNRIYVGGQSTIGLLASTSTVYETFNSNEAGADSLPVVPSEITYISKTISSLQTQYYNRSDIFLQYNVSFSTLDTANLAIDPDNYRWMVVMVDPNGVSKDVTLSPRCQFANALSFTCSAGETLDFAWPSPGWLIGTWSAKLYEINTVTQNRALIATSSSFTVLNTTVNNQSIINPPSIPPSSGTAPQAITLIDGFVLWLGMGINSVSKLLFAMIFIAIAATVGLIWGNGNVAMVFAFVPYAFFAFIEYIPKWIFIIAIILIAVASRAFR